MLTESRQIILKVTDNRLCGWNPVWKCRLSHTIIGAMEPTAITLFPAPELQPAGMFAPNHKAARHFLKFFTLSGHPKPANSGHRKTGQ
jgi:hypothetical protein